MTSQTFDVVVIGAGLSGLAASITLVKAGKSVAILEARDRIGGRIHTLHDPNWPVPLEYGAEFVHGRPPELMKLLRAANLSVYDVTDTHFAPNAFGKLRREEDFWDEMDKVFKKIDRHRGEDCSFEWFVENRLSLPRRLKELVYSYVEGFDAADPARVGIGWLGVADKAEEKLGDGLFRVAGGYGGLVEAMLTQMGDKAVIRLNTIVEQIMWSRGKVAIFAKPHEYHATKTVITLPLGVLHAPPGEVGSVSFIPKLPNRHVMERMHMGAVIKLFLQFDDPFWEEAVDKQASFMHAPREPVLTWWSSLPYRSPVLTGWIGGPRAEHLSKESDEMIVDASINTLSRMTRVSRSRLQSMLRAWRVMNWQADPFSRGAYSYGGINGEHAAAELAKPIQDTLYLAGEATHPGMNGTVFAAIASGERAAKQILKNT